jgi:hypothetical protein
MLPTNQTEAELLSEKAISDAQQTDLTSEDDAPKYIPVRKRAPIDRSSKIIIFLISLCGFSALVLAGWLIMDTITSPFKLDIQQIATTATSTDPSITDALKTKDTDGDGLSDYEEVYAYNTSPYLKDTDGDGLPDGTEVKNGTDPNCKTGDTCRSIRLVNPDTKLSDLLPEFSPADKSLRDATLKEFRGILLQSGMDQATLDSLSDDALLVYMDAIVRAADLQSEPVDVNSLSESDMRNFLIQAGLKEAEVNRLPPEDLRDLIKSLQ